MDSEDRNVLARVEAKMEMGFRSLEARMKRMEEKVIIGNGQKSLLVRQAETELAITELKKQHDERQSAAESAAVVRATIISALIGSLTVLGVAIVTSLGG